MNSIFQQLSFHFSITQKCLEKIIHFSKRQKWQSKLYLITKGELGVVEEMVMNKLHT